MNTIIKNQRIFVKGASIVLAIIIVIVIIGMWAGYGELKSKTGKPIELTTPKKIIITLVGIMLLILICWQYKHQKNIDLEQYKQKNIGEKALSVAYKIGGWDLRLRAIGSWIGALIFLSFGIYTLMYNQIVLFFIGLILAIIFILVGVFYWKRSKSFVKGRYY